MEKKKYYSKIRLRKTKKSLFTWETYTKYRGWISNGSLENAILHRCKFDGESPSHEESIFVYCDNFYVTDCPMINSVNMYGAVVDYSDGSILCDNTPIRHCEQAIIMDGKIFRIT